MLKSYKYIKGESYKYLKLQISLNQFLSLLVGLAPGQNLWWHRSEDEDRRQVEVAHDGAPQHPGVLVLDIRSILLCMLKACFECRKNAFLYLERIYEHDKSGYVCTYVRGTWTWTWTWNFEIFYQTETKYVPMYLDTIFHSHLWKYIPRNDPSYPVWNYIHAYENSYLGKYLGENTIWVTSTQPKFSVHT
jgi:hypothetical protein